MVPRQIPDLCAKTPKDILVDEIEDEELCQMVRHFRGMFPMLRVLHIYYVLQTFNKDDTAAVSYFTDDRLPAYFSKDIARLKGLFPTLEEDRLRLALFADIGDFVKAKRRLEIEQEVLKDSATTNATKPSPSPITSTSTMTTSHINDKIQSFPFRHTTSAMKSKPVATSASRAGTTPVVIDLTGDDEDETLTNSHIEQCLSPSLPSIRKEGGTTASRFKVENLQEDPENEDNYSVSEKGNDVTSPNEKSLEGKVASLFELFPGASRVACGTALEICGGSEEGAFEILKIQFTPRFGRDVTSLTNDTRTSSISKPTTITTPTRKVETSTSSSQGCNFNNVQDYFPRKLDAGFDEAAQEHYQSEESFQVESPVEEEDLQEDGQGEGEDFQEDDQVEEEVFEREKVERPFESFLYKVPHAACSAALQQCDGNEEDALESLNEERRVYYENEEKERDKNGSFKGPGGRDILGELDTPDRCHGAGQVCEKPSAMQPSSTALGKRRAASPLPRIPKRTRGLDSKDAKDYFAGAEDEAESKAEVVQSNLAPAGEWLTEMWSNGSGHLLHLGIDKIPRDRVPDNILCENFPLLKAFIDQHRNRESGTSNPRIRLPDVKPEAFDLLVQFVSCDNIGFKVGPKEENITLILAMIEAARLLQYPFLSSLTEIMVSKLEGILRGDHFALKAAHIREAYCLEKDGEPIQELFVKASVRPFMVCKDDDFNYQFENDEDDEMTAAQQAAYSGSGFVFSQAMKKFPQFEKALWNEVGKCLRQREEKIVRPKRGKVMEETVPLFTDPLDPQGEPFRL